jgi:hypothetical protein
LNLFRGKQNDRNKLSDETIDLGLDAVNANTDWHKNIESFTGDKDLTELLNSIDLREIKDYKSLPLTVRRQILKIGRKYGKSKENETGITDKTIRLSFDKTLC